MIDIIRQSIEYQNWGWNALIISSVATIIFTVIEGWGLWKQRNSISEAESGESVSVSWHTYFTLMFVAFSIFGVHIKSIAIVFNGFLGLGHSLILLGLWRHKSFTQAEKWLGISFVAIPLAMLILPWKNWVYLLMSFGSLFALAMQPWEIWKNKNAGVVDIRLIGTYFLATFFWVVYSFKVGNWALKVITPSALLILGSASMLWFIYRKNNVKGGKP